MEVSEIGMDSGKKAKREGLKEGEKKIKKRRRMWGINCVFRE